MSLLLPDFHYDDEDEDEDEDVDDDDVDQVARSGRRARQAAEMMSAEEEDFRQRKSSSSAEVSPHVTDRVHLNWRTQGFKETLYFFRQSVTFVVFECGEW